MTDDKQTNIAQITPAVGTRIDFLDGVRGWASFIVLLHHILGRFLALSTPFLLYDKARLSGDILSHNYIDLLPGIVVRVFTDGYLAVVVFFVLSGYALSFGHLDLAKRKLALATTSRYFRLMIPVLFTSLIAYLFLKFHLMYNVEAATTPESSSEWLGTFYTFDANIKDVIRFSLYDVFFKHNIDKNYNVFLWTMPIEILGSFIIYAYLAIFRATEKIHWKLAILATITLFVVNPLLSCFLIGYMIGEANKKYNGAHLFGFLKTKRTDVIFVFVFIMSAVLSECVRANNHLLCIFASVIVTSASLSPTLKSFFSNRLSRYLGRISFPLYLIQITIICSWSSYLYVKLPEFGMDRVTSNLVNLFSTVVLAIISATLLLPVEKFSVIYSRKIGSLFLK